VGTHAHPSWETYMSLLLWLLSLLNQKICVYFVKSISMCFTFRLSFPILISKSKTVYTYFFHVPTPLFSVSSCFSSLFISVFLTSFLLYISSNQCQNPLFFSFILVFISWFSKVRIK